MNAWIKLHLPLLILAVSGQLRAQATPQDALGAKSPATETDRELPGIRVRVLDPEGNPLPGAKVLASIWTKEKGFKATRRYSTQADGFARVELPRSHYILRLWASKKSYATMFSHWEQKNSRVASDLPSIAVAIESSSCGGTKMG